MICQVCDGGIGLFSLDLSHIRVSLVKILKIQNVFCGEWHLFHLGERSLRGGYRYVSVLLYHVSDGETGDFTIKWSR